MVEKTAAVAAETETEEDEGETEAQRAEPLNRSQKADPFAAAFEKAEREVDGEAEPAPKKTAKPKPVKSEDEGEPEEKPAKAERPVKKAKPAPKDEDEASDEASDTEDEEADDAKPKGKVAKAPEKDEKADKTAEAEPKAKPEPKPKQPLTAKQWWPKERREAFQYQPREVQEMWLTERPVADAHWSEEQKANFAKLPQESQEVLIVQARELERGFNTKFQALAAERKTIEAMKAAVSPEMRAHMEKLKLDEPAVFSRLLAVQAQSMKDPVAYARDFITRNRIDPRQLFPAATGEDGTEQPPAHQAYQQQADIASHPVVNAMAAEIHTLKQAVETEQQKRAQEDDRRRSEELEQVLSEKDEEGNSRYPYIRVLSAPMSEIIESDPERYRSMGVKEQIAEAYRLALANFPELTPPKKTVAPAPVDEPEEEETDSEEEAQAEKLKKAATKKSKTPNAAPSSGGDPFSKAFSRAERQIGHR